MNVDVHEAKTDLLGLIDKVKAGEEIIITSGDTEVQLVPKTKKKETAKKFRQPGALRGQIWMADDFDEWPDDFAFPFGKAKK